MWAVSDQLTCHSVCLCLPVYLCGRNLTPDMDSFRSVDLLFCCLPVCLCVWKKSNPRHGQFKISWSAIQCLCLPVCLCLSVNLFVCVEETQPQTWAVSDQWICHSVHLFACQPLSVCLCGRNPNLDVNRFRSVDLSFSVCSFACPPISIWKKPNLRHGQFQVGELAMWL